MAARLSREPEPGAEEPQKRRVAECGGKGVSISRSGSGSRRGSSGKGGRVVQPCRRDEGVAGPVLSPLSAAGCRIGRCTHASTKAGSAPGWCDHPRDHHPFTSGVG